MSDEPQQQKSLYAKILGRSLFSIAFGTFFEKKANAASLIALLLVFTLCYLIVAREKYELTNALLYLVFVVVGYYLGSKQAEVKPEEDD